MDLPDLNLKICIMKCDSKIIYREAYSYQETDAVYVTTGGPVPSYFDAVIPIEDTELVSYSSEANANTLIKLTRSMSQN